jgi:hypothetical protein
VFQRARIASLHDHHRLALVEQPLFFKQWLEQIFSQDQDEYHRDYKAYDQSGDQKLGVSGSYPAHEHEAFSLRLLIHLFSTSLKSLKCGTAFPRSRAVR